MKEGLQENPKQSWVARTLFAAACLATLVALFYAEEDWRGWHRWHEFEKSWQAKGEHLDLASSVPPPVPADRNFAMTPIAFTSYGSMLTRDGKVIPNQQRDQHFDARMRMTVAPDRRNVADKFSGNRVKLTFTDLAGWQSYYRTLAAQTNLFQVPTQPGSPADDVLLALSKYDSVIEELRDADKLPESRFPLDYDNDSPWAIILPHLAVLKGCAQVLQLRSAAELQSGRIGQALEDVRLGLDLTDKIRTEPCLISHLVRLAMLQIMLQTVWEGLAQNQWQDTQLLALDTDLARLDFIAGYRLGMHGEMGGQTGEMDLIRRHRAALLQDLGVVGNGGDYYLPTDLAVRLIPTGWLYENEYRSVRIVTDYYLPAADIDHGTFSTDLVNRGDATLAAETKWPGCYNWYEKLMVPGLTNAVKKFAYGQTSVHLARIAVALERYRRLHGEYPEALDVLVPQVPGRRAAGCDRGTAAEIPAHQRWLVRPVFRGLEPNG